MRKFRSSIGRIALAVAALLLLVQDGTVLSGSQVSLTGEFLWEHMNHTGDLDAVFTNTGEDGWDVEFRFLWEDELHVYHGTAEGDLIDGELHGSIVTSNAQRPQTFYFTGRFENGRFSGTHTARQASGGLHPTGTLTLGR